MATSEAIEELLDKMTAEREALLAQVEALSDEEASFAPLDGEGEAQWSPKQQLAHLAEMETTYRAWVERALAEDAPDVAGVIGERPAIGLEQAQEHEVGALTRQLREQRDITLRLVRSLSPEQFERTASQPMFGSLTVMQWLRSYYRHDRMHRDQIAGREPEYKPRFVGGKEPDQRRGPRV
ncbi:MAG TPA: DinB family protein [Dehalococcoidia bacterium]|nr:DinB family protein [Dehalococcoidia bacterium]